MKKVTLLLVAATIISIVTTTKSEESRNEEHKRITQNAQKLVKDAAEKKEFTCVYSGDIRPFTVYVSPSTKSNNYEIKEEYGGKIITTLDGNITLKTACHEVNTTIPLECNNLTSITLNLQDKVANPTQLIKDALAQTKCVDQGMWLQCLYVNKNNEPRPIGITIAKLPGQEKYTAYDRGGLPLMEIDEKKETLESVCKKVPTATMNAIDKNFESVEIGPLW